MSRFVVRFMKDVLGENGRQAEICQSTVEVDASSEGHATELAKRKFCEPSRYAIGRCMPTGFRSGRPIFRPDLIRPQPVALAALRLPPSVW